MNTKKNTLIIIFALVLTLLVSGCVSTSYNIPDSTPDVVKIVFVSPAEGINAREGIPARNAFALAVKQANDSETFPYHIEAVFIDETDDVVATTAALNEVLDGGDIFAVCGYWYSENANNAIVTLRDKKVPLIIWGAVAQELTTPKFMPYVTRICPVAEQENKMLYNFSEQVVKENKWFIIYDNSFYGMANYNKFQALLLANGKTIVGSVMLNADEETNYTALAESVRTVIPDAIYYGGTTSHLPALREEFYSANVAYIPFFCLSGTLTQPLLELRKNVVEGIYTVGNATDAGHQWGDEFAQAYLAAAYEAPPGVFTGYAYDAAGIILQALKNCGEIPTPQKIAEGIAGIQYDGLLSSISFDEKGQAKDYYGIYRIFSMKSNKWVEVSP